MIRIGVRELRQHASRYLDVVKAGGTVEVTERGELVAVIVPPSPAVALRDRLVSQGRLSPAKAPFRPPARRLPTDAARAAGTKVTAGSGTAGTKVTKRTASDALAELRVERFE